METLPRSGLKVNVVIMKKPISRKAQKQPPKLICKNSCSEKFCNIHRKAPVVESLFDKVDMRWEHCPELG